MEKNKTCQFNGNNIPPEFRVVVSRCMNCKDGVRYPRGFEIPPKGRYPRCSSCRQSHLQFYTGDIRKLKGGLKNYRMADEKAKKSAAKPAKAAKKTGDKKKSPRGYDDAVRNKVVDLGKQGKSVKEIEKAVGPSGPKAKAIIRYLKAAGVKDIKRK